MQQHQRGSLPALDVVQANTIDFDEASHRRIFTLGFFSLMAHDQCKPRYRRSCGTEHRDAACRRRIAKVKEGPL